MAGTWRGRRRCSPSQEEVMRARTVGCHAEEGEGEDARAIMELSSMDLWDSVGV